MQVQNINQISQNHNLKNSRSQSFNGKLLITDIGQETDIACEIGPKIIDKA